jgi:hypothetical protein
MVRTLDRDSNRLSYGETLVLDDFRALSDVAVYVQEVDMHTTSWPGLRLRHGRKGLKNNNLIFAGTK